MNKNSIKKLIISIVFIVFLIMFFLFEKNINDNKSVGKISIVKSIVKEKYDRVFFDENSKYIYTLKKDDHYIYDVFDLHGNKLYSIKSNKELNIIKTMKKYYITYDGLYHLYNSENDELKTGKVIEGINDYLIKIDNSIINYNNETIFSDIHDLKTYCNDRYLNINNYYLTNKKGEILLENTVITDEIKNNYLTDYLIVKKNNKYYTFFINIDKIIGDGFEQYSLDNNEALILNNNTIYKIYNTGLRKKEKTISKEIVNNYFLKKDYIMKNNIFAIEKTNNYFGILNLNNNKFTKITNKSVNSIKKIDNNNFIIKTDNNNYVFNIKSKRIILKTKKDINSILIFNNNYKTIRNKNEYTLFDNKDKEIITLDKQIVIKEKIKAGNIENEFYLYNIKKKSKNLFNKKIIDKKVYYYNDNGVYNEDFIIKYKSDIIILDDQKIVYKKDDELIINNKKENKVYNYSLIDGEEVINIKNFGKILILENSNYIKILDDKGNSLKKIKNKNLINYYSSESGHIIIITGKRIDGNYYYGSYLAE
ncbi:MAG: hypothetical protein J6O56_01450 [Bacilli bacterium]|nr:hypothetical protein [Bacilli bacterium]